MLLWSQQQAAPGIHTRTECRGQWDFLWRRQWDVCDCMFVTTLCEVAPPGFLGDLLPAGFEEASCRVVGCHMERPAQQGRWFLADHHQETAHQSNTPPGTQCCQGPRELGGGFFSREASDETCGHSGPLHCRLVRASTEESVSRVDP